MTQQSNDTLPRNVLRVDFDTRVIGLIHRGHVDVGIGVVRDRNLRDKFEKTHFVFEGGVYIRLTQEIVADLIKRGSFTSFILSMEKKGEKVVARMELAGKKSEISFDDACVGRIRDFLAHGAAMGNVIARFLDGADPQALVDAAQREQSRNQPPARGKGTSARAVLNALNAFEKGPQKPRGNEPGGLGVLGDKVGDKLPQIGGKTPKKAADPKPAPKAKPAPEPEPTAPEPEAPTKTVTTVEVAEVVEPTITAKQARMYLAALKENGGDLNALTVSPENLGVIREEAEKAGIVLKETEHTLQ